MSLNLRYKIRGYEEIDTGEISFIVFDTKTEDWPDGRFTDLSTAFETCYRLNKVEEDEKNNVSKSNTNQSKLSEPAIGSKIPQCTAVPIVPYTGIGSRDFDAKSASGPK